MSNQTMKFKERREYAPRSRRASVLPNLDLWPVTTGHQTFNISMREFPNKKLCGSRFCARNLDGSDLEPFTYNDQRTPYSLKRKTGRVRRFSLVSLQCHFDQKETL